MEPEPRTPRWRQQWQLLQQQTLAPQPAPPAGSPDRLALVRYGLAQPFMGLRLILRSSDLLGISLAPACGVLLLAGTIGFSQGVDEGWVRGVLAFFVAIVALAPIPSLLFGRVYAHLAAKARTHLELPPHQPYIRSMGQLLGEWVAQLLVLALGASMFIAIARWALGPLGPVVAVIIQGAWSLHWIVVEGYDNSRTLPPGTTVAQLEEQARAMPGDPWFHRWIDELRVRGIMRVLLMPFHMVSSLTTHFARHWRQEIALVEQRPWISLGFGLGVAAMLAVPGLNLLLRPAVVVAGVNLRHQLLEREPAGAAASAGGTQPYPVVPPGAA